MVLFQPMTGGSLTYVPLFTKSIAGAESNVAVGLTRLGVKTRWISRLGTDPFGDQVLSTLAGEGVDVSAVTRDAESPTGIYFKEFKGLGDPTVYFYRKLSAASLFTPESLNPQWFAGAKHLHITGILPALGAHTAETALEAMRIARKQGMTISFDPNLRRKLWSEERAREVLLAMIPLCDYFLPGLEEAEFLVGEHTESDYAKIFLDQGVKVVAMKLGERGSMGFYEQECIKAEPYKISTIVDTVGAGDAFAAGFLSVMLDQSLSDKSTAIDTKLKLALERANLLGALATQFKGDWEGLPTLAEVERILSGAKNITR
ncbi:sugar kinase [Paenibacillus psychroresistens]|uniref:Sugar kinase n=2 Tax=Paenibacillus psychroresistens TaxID=1778678 RepID=A0A6B8RUM3_9BACL|nr:sugar kinase [Paenibacillus psychroresistens]